MEKNFIKRTCDSPLCDTTEIITQGEELTGTTASGLARWVAVQTFKAVHVPDPKFAGQPVQPIGSGKWIVVPELKLACRAQCAINILKTGVAPEAEHDNSVPAVSEG